MVPRNLKRKFLPIRPITLAVAGVFGVYSQMAGALLTLHSVPELDPSPRGTVQNPSTYAMADEVTGNPQDVLHLIGNAEIRRGGSTLKGDRITYTQVTDEVEAQGNVLLSKDGTVFTGDQANYRIDAETGTMPKADYTFGPRGLRGCADQVDFVDGSHVTMSKARITSCPKGDNAWWVDMNRLDLDQGDLTAEGTGASLYLGGVPVMMMPWFEFPIGQQRKSGFLTPTLGMSTSKGIQIAVPYYWNIAPNYDYTITPNLMVKRGLMLENEFRYLQPNYSGKLVYNIMPHDRDYGESRYGLHFEHRYARDGFYAGVNYNRVSDDDYISDFSGNIRESSENVLNQDFWMGYGRDFWTTNLRVTKNQTLTSTMQAGQPYERVPQFSFNTYKGDIGGFEYIGHIEATRFTHPNPSRPDGDRFVIDQGISYPLRGSYWFIEPKARWIGTWYSMQKSDAMMGDVALEKSASREVPILSFDTGLVFDRQTSWFGNAAEQTLEPRLFYAYIPYRNQDRLPVFDTTLSDLNITQLFQESVFSGYDRISQANQLTAALTTRYLDSASGIEWFRGTIGQRFYFDDQKVGIYDYYTNQLMGIRTDSKSDLLGSVGVRLARTLTADGTVQYSSSEGRVSRAYAGFRWQPKRASAVSLYYRYNYAPNDTYNNIKQLDLAAQWPITDKLYVVGRYNYSFNKKGIIEALGGFEYHADCWTLRAVVQRYITSTNKYDNTFFLQLELNGLGSVGTNPVSELQESIPGYQSRSPVPSVTGRYEYYD